MPSAFDERRNLLSVMGAGDGASFVADGFHDRRETLQLHAALLHLDFRDDDWVEKLSPERRAELDEIRDGDVARSIAQQHLVGKPH